MAYTMNFTDPNTGATYPSSYWCVSAVNLDLINVVAQVSMNVYVDATNYLNGNGPITSRQFTLFGTEYTTILASAAPATATGTTNKQELFSILNGALSSSTTVQQFFSTATFVADVGQ